MIWLLACAPVDVGPFHEAADIHALRSDGARVAYWGAPNVRVVDLDGVVFAEIPTVDPGVWSPALRPEAVAWIEGGTLTADDADLRVYDLAGHDPSIPAAAQPPRLSVEPFVAHPRGLAAVGDGFVTLEAELDRWSDEDGDQIGDVGWTSYRLVFRDARGGVTDVLDLPEPLPHGGFGLLAPFPVVKGFVVTDAAWLLLAATGWDAKLWRVDLATGAAELAWQGARPVVEPGGSYACADVPDNAWDYVSGLLSTPAGWAVAGQRLACAQLVVDGGAFVVGPGGRAELDANIDAVAPGRALLATGGVVYEVDDALGLTQVAAIEARPVHLVEAAGHVVWADFSRMYAVPLD